MVFWCENNSVVSPCPRNYYLCYVHLLREAELTLSLSLLTGVGGSVVGGAMTPIGDDQG